MKCDLHVHTTHSGMCTVPLLRRVCRESYNDPAELYVTLKSRGMDLVTVTDHDTIGASEDLRRYHDFFLSEEVTCTLPSGATAHIGVYDITEAQHIELQRRRDDFYSFAAYLSAQRLFWTVNHFFSSLTGHRRAEDFLLVEDYAPGLETHNGALHPYLNKLASSMAARLPAPGMGGSDAHTLRGAGRTWTQATDASTKAEFFEQLRARRTTVHGESGSFSKLTLDICSIAFSMFHDQPWTLSLAPLLMVLPAFTAGCLARDLAFAGYWSRWASEHPALDRLAGGVTP